MIGLRASGVADAILSTLIQNAVTAMSRPEHRVPAQLRLHCERLGDEIGFTLADNGPGVDALLGDRLFDPLASGSHGTGLGLFFGRQLAESVDGSLELSADTVGLGAEFLLRLPIVPSDQETRDGA